MLVESANIPMPSEATMLFAGFKVDDGDLTLLGITAAGVLGNIVGSWGGYAIGYWGREELLERHHVFHVSPKQMARVEGWFERYGAVTVFFTRMLPIVRTFISTPAGAAHMNFWKFTLYTAAGLHPLGADARASSASRSARTGRSGATSSTTSTTSSSPA